MNVKLKLKRSLERAVSSGHPWVYGDALEGGRGLPVGTDVELATRNGRPMARGLYDPGSPIALRIYPLDPRQRIDAALVRQRLDAALALRFDLLDRSQTDAFRWCNGEGDRLPGVVVDIYADVAVVRFDGDAARTLEPHVTAAVRDVAAARGLALVSIYERSRGGVGRTLLGPVPGQVAIREHGVALTVDVLRGQKTGFFLDQRENRRRIRAITSGKRVANLFSYTGGFSVNAALGGATHVASVDIAPAAIEAARVHFTLNGLDPSAHEFSTVDAFEWLAQAKAERRSYDIVITDPPSFAPSERALDAALSAYRELNTEALALVPDGGLLVAASCSSHVTMEAFLQVLGEVGRTARRPLTTIEVLGQPLDHPTPPAFPEGRYLKLVISKIG